MSDRGSFVTEYVYCSQCFAALKKLLVDDQERGKFFSATAVPHYDGKLGEHLPIIAGKIGGNGGLSAANEFSGEFEDDIRAAICHPVRFAFFNDAAEGDAETVVFEPTEPQRGTS